MNGPTFDAYVETQLAPRLKPSLSSTLSRPTRAPEPQKSSNDAAAGSSSCRPTARTLNPIEQAFAKLKAHLRRIRARSYDAPIQALGEVWNLFNPNKCRIRVRLNARCSSMLARCIKK